MIPLHITALKKTASVMHTSSGKQIEVWELDVPTDDSFLNNWAVSFRQHYCADGEIDLMRSGTGMSRGEYLTQIVFPDQTNAPGPSVRSGDFAELLVTDYVEHVLGYWVTRGKYADKQTRDDSVKGVDILGFKQIDPNSHNPGDVLLAFEAKALCSVSPYGGQLQSAVDDSSKDFLRRAFTLNATKRRLLSAGEQSNAQRIERFQNVADRPYLYRSGAAAVLSDTAYDELEIATKTTTLTHQNENNLELIVIRGKALMKLVHALYDRAANEA